MCIVKTPKVQQSSEQEPKDPTIIRNPYLDGLGPEAKALRRGRSSLRIERVRGGGGSNRRSPPKASAKPPVGLPPGYHPPGGTNPLPPGAIVRGGGGGNGNRGPGRVHVAHQ